MPMRPSQYPDVNTASAEELERTFEVDRDTAQNLIRKREELGGFTSWDDVKQVPGCDAALIRDLQEAGLTLGRSHQ